MEKIYVDISSKKGKVRGYILDISTRGASIASLKKIDKDTSIDIVTRSRILPHIQGKIVSAVYAKQRKSYKYRLGIKFIAIQKNAVFNRFIHKIEHRRAARLNFSQIWKQG